MISEHFVFVNSDVIATFVQLGRGLSQTHRQTGGQAAGWMMINALCGYQGGSGDAKRLRATYN